MSNCVYNKLTICGGFEDLDVFTDGLFDFNKVIPQPEELKDNISDGYDSIGLYLLWEETMSNLVAGTDVIGNTIKSKQIISAYQDLNIINHDIRSEADKSKKVNDKEAAIRQGRCCYENFIKYGHCNWYGWCIENWSTKWNCWDSEMINLDTIFFVTACNMPENIVKKLSKMVPGREVTITWADEGIDSNSGVSTYVDGKLFQGGFVEPYTKEYYQVLRSLGVPSYK